MRLTTTAAMFAALAVGLSLVRAAGSDATEITLKNNRFTPDCLEAPAGPKAALPWRPERRSPDSSTK